MQERFDAVAALLGAAAVKRGREAFRRDRGGRLAQEIDEDVDLLGVTSGPFGLVGDGDDGEVGFLLDAVGTGALVIELGDRVAFYTLGLFVFGLVVAVIGVL